MATERTEITPPRQGIKFRGETSLSETHWGYNVKLYLQGQDDPIYEGPADPGMRVNAVDQAFQSFVAAGNYENIPDQFKPILQQYKKEKETMTHDRKTWKKLTYRFLRAEENEKDPLMNGDENLSFILTDDKRDVVEFEAEEIARKKAERKEKQRIRAIKNGEFKIDPRPITESERQFLENLSHTEVIHFFGRSGVPCWALVENTPTQYTQSDRDRYSPTNGSIDGATFLSLIVRAGLATNEQVKDLFPGISDKFDIHSWATLPGLEWPALDYEGMAKLAKTLGKKGVQKYGWDGGYGDISESWKTSFIPADSIH